MYPSQDIVDVGPRVEPSGERSRMSRYDGPGPDQRDPLSAIWSIPPYERLRAREEAAELCGGVTGMSPSVEVRVVVV